MTKIIEKENLTKIGKEPVVILPLEEYEKLKEDLEMLQSKKLAKEIEKARKEVKKGEVIALDDLERKLVNRDVSEFC